jgi:hypothetical protein
VGGAVAGESALAGQSTALRGLKSFGGALSARQARRRQEQARAHRAAREKQEALSRLVLRTAY